MATPPAATAPEPAIGPGPNPSPVPATRGRPLLRRVMLVFCSLGLILAALLVPISWTALIDVSRMRISGGQISTIAGSLRDGAISFQHASQPAPWSISGHAPGVVISWRTLFQRDRGQNALPPSIRPGRFIPAIASTAAGNRYSLPTWNLALLLGIASWLLARRHRRLSRFENHQCPACGYTLTGIAPTAPCPECGRPQAFASPTPAPPAPPPPTSAPPIQ